MREARQITSNARVFMSGIQALVQLPIEQMRLDAAHGLRSKAFITGYPGSPLGGYDLALARAKTLLEQHGIRHQPGQNEDLAATSLIGTQMLDQYPHPDVDGVVGYWYGKGPGIDRSGDALKHGNFAGTSTHGAVVIMSGEDHEAKSSSVPYCQEFAFEHFGIPVLYPASVAEFITFGIHAAALSRYSGCWVALKLVGPLCDGGEDLELASLLPQIILPDVQIEGEPFQKRANFRFFPVLNIATEHELYAERHRAVAAYARANALNETLLASDRDRIGIIAAGKSFTDTRQALADLGLTEGQLRESGIRLAKVGLLCPPQDGFFEEFSRGLGRIIVIEEKRDFLERLVGRAACAQGGIQISGKTGRDGKPLFPVAGSIDADLVASLLARELKGDICLPSKGIARLKLIENTQQSNFVPLAKRTPNYCSGCPHNVSVKLAPGQVAWGAPGCHVFAALMEQPERRIEALTQFGGEGMPWIGLAPYTSKRHMVQNIGDGSLFHSSYQNIRYAVTAGVNITFRILYNGVIANTGGQSSGGDLGVTTLLKKLKLDGVTRSILIAKNRQLYAKVDLPRNVVIRSPRDVQASMAELAQTQGVTVLLYDGDCANERRRRQKRGRQPSAQCFTVVNEDVCENCGDCGRKANCMSLQKVPTEFGLKTQIQQSSCSQDFACIEGECPSFVTVEVKAGTGLARPSPPRIDVSIPDAPIQSLDRAFHIYMPGVGGTGVITANSILAHAAALDGLSVKTYDQTGAAQKWGAVLSSIIIAPRGQAIISNKVGVGQADLYLALDVLAAADRSNLACCSPGATVAVINSDVLPSGEMIRNVDHTIRGQVHIAAIEQRTTPQRNITIAACGIAQGLFGDFIMTNMIALGAAYQAGHLPISAASIERAIEVNGAQVTANIAAFRAGRLSQTSGSGVNERAVAAIPLANHLKTFESAPSPSRRRRVADLIALAPSLRGELKRLAQIRVEDLIDYQNSAYARAYIVAIEVLAAAAMTKLPGHADDLIVAAVRNLYKLMAYKDEYETARLLTDPHFAERVRAAFPGFRGMQFNLQPPFLRSFGLRKKIALGGWFRPLLRILATAKFVRGTPFDPFKNLAARKTERDLIAWYLNLMKVSESRLSLANLNVLEEILSLPQSIRGYEDLKIQSADNAFQQATALVGSLQTDGDTSPLRSHRSQVI